MKQFSGYFEAYSISILQFPGVQATQVLRLDYSRQQ